MSTVNLAAVRRVQTLDDYRLAVRVLVMLAHDVAGLTVEGARSQAFSMERCGGQIRYTGDMPAARLDAACGILDAREEAGADAPPDELVTCARDTLGLEVMDESDEEAAAVARDVAIDAELPAAARFVTAHWRHVEAIAGALIERKRLSGGEVSGLIEHLPWPSWAEERAGRGKRRRGGDA